MSGYFHTVESLPREELRELQFARLRTMVAELYAESPFYREKWRGSGFAPGDLKSLEDLRGLPLVTKAELRSEQAAHPPFGRLTATPRALWREVHPSSGTTGRRILTVWTQDDVEVIADFTARLMWGFGVRGDHVVQNAFSYGLWVAGIAVHYASAKLGCLNVPIGAQPAGQQLEFLRAAHPAVLMATPSFGLFLAETLRKAGVDPRELGLRLGAFGGEAGVEAPATRRRLEEGLGIRAYDIYGLAEIGPTMGAECKAQAGLHWAEDHFLIEIVDPASDEPLGEGELGMLVITHLTRQGTPMVRYATNDVARYTSERCTCGRTHGRSPGGIVGRNDDLVIYRGAKFYPTQVEDVVRSLPGFTGEYVIEISGGRDGPAHVTVVAEAVQAELEIQLRRALKEALLVTPQVRTVSPGALGRTEFKTKRVVRMA